MGDCRKVERRNCVEAVVETGVVNSESNASQNHRQKTSWALVEIRCDVGGV